MNDAWANGEVEATPTKDELEAFYLPKAVNDGIKFVLTDSKGKDTEHWLMVRGRWSDAYQNAIADANRTRSSEARLPESIPRTSEIEIGLREKAALISGWSFARPCTPDAVLALFRKNYKLAVDIEILAWNEANFFDK